MSSGPTALLLFSHGSVLCDAGRILRDHVDRLRQAGHPIVEHGFLNYSSPTFENAVQRCVDLGATRIVILPYFVVAGKFVTEDLPPRIEEARHRHPDMQFEIAEPILDHSLLVDAILEMAEQATGLHAIPNAMRKPDECELRPDCPLFKTNACPRSQATT